MDRYKRLIEVVDLVAGEETSTFKIVILQDAYAAGIVTKLLTRSRHLPGDSLTQLGGMASDAQNAALLRRRRPIVVVPGVVLACRCLFCPPPGTTKLAIINALGEKIQVRHRECSDEPFELQSGRV